MKLALLSVMLLIAFFIHDGVIQCYVEYAIKDTYELIVSGEI